jgi:hypothetical protein
VFLHPASARHLSNSVEKFCPTGEKPCKLPMACTGRRLYPCGVLMSTGKPGLARVMRYAPTKSLPRITKQYMPATVIAILMEHAETLPQHTASGLKSTSGSLNRPVLQGVPCGFRLS